MVLSHEMIAHHHHDELSSDFFVTFEADIEHEHKHPRSRENQHNNIDNSQQEEKDSEHNHPFPFHHHISATNDFTIERATILESNNQIRDISFLVFAELFRTEPAKPPNLEGKLYEKPPFLITSLSYLEAFALRGPPTIV